MDVRDRNETQLAAVFRRFSVTISPRLVERETRLKNEKDKKSEASLMGAYIDVRDRNETQLAAVFRRFSVEFFPAEQMNMQMLNHLSTIFALVDNHTIPFF